MQTHSSPITTSAKRPFRQFILASASGIILCFYRCTAKCSRQRVRLPRKRRIEVWFYQTD